MRFALGSLPMAQERPRVPRGAVIKRAEGVAVRGHGTPVRSMPAWVPRLAGRQVWGQPCTLESTWPASQRPRPGHKADVLKGTGIDCIGLVAA